MMEVKEYGIQVYNQIFKIGEAKEINGFDYPIIPVCQVFQLEDEDDTRDVFISVNGMVYDEYTRTHHFLIEVYVDGDDNEYCIFDSSQYNQALQTFADFRAIPSEYFINHLLNIFEDTHSG